MCNSYQLFISCGLPYIKWCNTVWNPNQEMKVFTNQKKTLYSTPKPSLSCYLDKFDTFYFQISYSKKRKFIDQRKISSLANTRIILLKTWEKKFYLKEMEFILLWSMTTVFYDLHFYFTTCNNYLESLSCILWHTLTWFHVYLWHTLTWCYVYCDIPWLGVTYTVTYLDLVLHILWHTLTWSAIKFSIICSISSGSVASSPCGSLF